MNTIHPMSGVVTPVAMISACGLIILAFYNRLGAVLARIRAFQQQKIELLNDTDWGGNADKKQMLLNIMDSQIRKVTMKARMIQNGLYALLSSVLAFLCCSLLVTASIWHETVGVIAVGIHTIGHLLFAAGVGWAIRELSLSLAPIEEESRYLELLKARGAMKASERISISEAA